MPTVVPLVPGKDGIMVPQSVPIDAFESWVSGGSAYFLTTEDLFTYPPPASPRSSITGVLASNRTTAATFFGAHVHQTANIPAALAAMPCAALRAHDSGGGMRWHNLNPSSGSFSWANADAWIDAAFAAGKDIIMVLGFTPDWAAASTPNTGAYDNGTTVRASNQPPSNMAAWDTYCTTVATRYLGKVKFYEVWNEPNYSRFWAGSDTQLAQLLRRANQAIKAVDATAKIICPAVAEPEGAGLTTLTAVLDASDGAAGTGKQWVDIVGVHLYPPTYNYQIHAKQLTDLRAALTARSMSALPIWNTEFGVLDGHLIADRVQSKWVGRSLLLQAALGVERAFWYSWDNPTMFVTPEDIAAWKAARTALLSGTMTGCNIAPDGRVACTINGTRYLY